MGQVKNIYIFLNYFSKGKKISRF